MLSLPSDDRTPLSPKTRASNAASSATIVKTTLDRHASATEPAMFAPSDCKDSARARVRLKTVRRSPDRNRLFAIPVPILPSPISPISTSDSSLSKELAAPPITWLTIVAAPQPPQFRQENHHEKAFPLLAPPCRKLSCRIRRIP